VYVLFDVSAKVRQLGLLTELKHFLFLESGKSEPVVYPQSQIQGSIGQIIAGIGELVYIGSAQF
jgi:hypothetical protein